MKNLILILLILALAGCKSTSVNKPKMLSASVGMKLGTVFDYYVNKRFDDSLTLAKAFVQKLIMIVRTSHISLVKRIANEEI